VGPSASRGSAGSGPRAPERIWATTSPLLATLKPSRSTPIGPPTLLLWNAITRGLTNRPLLGRRYGTKLLAAASASWRSKAAVSRGQIGRRQMAEPSWIRQRDVLHLNFCIDLIISCERAAPVRGFGDERDWRPSRVKTCVRAGANMQRQRHSRPALVSTSVATKRWPDERQLRMHDQTRRTAPPLLCLVNRRSGSRLGLVMIVRRVERSTRQSPPRLEDRRVWGSWGCARGRCMAGFRGPSESCDREVARVG
jgi:hypothetical protein